ncbi:MAG: hypothetical protein EP330_09615 [Deltaproteobacteria bacterium]|nr:MAG: hypothetical protein EP330_09615 [Deltaproteobacteria bacterium]
MQFTHRDDPTRTATYAQKGDEPAFVVEHTDAKGKTRKKSFKKGSVWQARDAAIRFLLNTEGYVLRAPQDGPVRWMARLQLDGYRGEIAHGVDPRTGVVWVHDAEDQVHRITPGSCVTTTVRLNSGNQSPGASIVAGVEGAWALAPSWKRQDGELVRHLQLFRVHDGVAARVAELVGNDLVDRLSRAADGKVLGPAEGGAGLYGEGGVERTFACTPGAGRPVAAVSDNGAWVVTSHGDHLIREDMATGEQTRFRADGFEGFNSAQITDDGAVFVSGFRYPSHGLWRLDPSAQPVRVSEDIRATVAADGRRLAQADHGRITVCDLTRESDDEMRLLSVISEQHLPVLGMAKYGRACFGPEGLAVLTDAYTVAVVDPA